MIVRFSLTWQSPFFCRRGEKKKKNFFSFSFLFFLHLLCRWVALLLITFAVPSCKSQCIVANLTACREKETRLVRAFERCVTCDLPALFQSVIPDDADSVRFLVHPFRLLFFFLQVKNSLDLLLRNKSDARERCWERYKQRYREQYLRRTCEDETEIEWYRLACVWGRVQTPVETILASFASLSFYSPNCSVWASRSSNCTGAWVNFNNVRARVCVFERTFEFPSCSSKDRRTIWLRYNVRRELGILDRISCSTGNDACLLAVSNKRRQV